MTIGCVPCMVILSSPDVVGPQKRPAPAFVDKIYTFAIIRTNNRTEDKRGGQSEQGLFFCID